MPDLLKNRYNYLSLHMLASNVKEVYPSFQVDEFINDVMDETWDTLELKARIRQIAVHLGRHLPTDYEQALLIIDKVAVNCPERHGDFTFMYFPDFVAVYGQDERHLELSIAALERYTSTSSSEFAVRPFIINHEKRMMQQMNIWARHSNEHVRRLASEGCRPMLPWGQALVHFKKDPSPILGILEQLKNDPSLYVRKSVANNLNDISKTHPDLVLEISRNWYGKDTHTDWIVKHGCRTLLKKGNKDALDIFGFTTPTNVSVQNFTLASALVTIGEKMTFSFQVSTKEAAKIRLEYGIHYMKANGRQNLKIFKISELSLKENSMKSCTKTHSFAKSSTRKLYPGNHSVTLIVNGSPKGMLDFEVLPSP